MMTNDRLCLDFRMKFLIHHELIHGHLYTGTNTFRDHLNDVSCELIESFDSLNLIDFKGNLLFM